MLTRNLLLLFSLVLLLVEADLNSNDNGIEVQSTESMNAISPHHPDTSSSSSETADAPAANQLTAPEPAAVSVEEEEDNEHSKSKEGGNKKFRPRSAKPARPAHPPQRPALMITNQSPTLPSQPIIPQLKALVRNQKPKRRSRINRL
ncbi:uncharacterized protein si:ch211-133n4.6 isoform X3 [Pungitius pungitius]|uniref:uncharacterized protein si:ch211-133n4.6 isoform X3 n=1 Tax=Pungitius pungitius TaxID=134920 RepID=UPI001886F58C|nr:uncharacterized protein si:ch211-133n4.6 isoform X3 [Pungitius pungitius]